MNVAMARVGDISTQVRGVSYDKADARKTHAAGLVPIVRGGNVQGGRLELDDLVYVPDGRVSSEQMLQPGDVVVVASSGSIDVVGKAAFVGQTGPLAFGAFCKVLRPRPT